jgi:alkylhydroperoxidase family enzyme
MLNWEVTVRHGRLTWLAPSDLDAAQRAVYDRIVAGPRAGGPFRVIGPHGRLEGPFNAMLVSPAVGGALQELGAAIRYRTSLRDRAREIAILTLAAERRSDFEWYAHVQVGRTVALTDTELDALRVGEGCASFRRDEDVVRRCVQALCRTADLDERLHAEAAKELGERATVELVMLVGYYDLLALSLRVWATPLPAGEVAEFATATVAVSSPTSGGER